MQTQSDPIRRRFAEELDLWEQNPIKATSRVIEEMFDSLIMQLRGCEARCQRIEEQLTGWRALAVWARNGGAHECRAFEVSGSVRVTVSLLVDGKPVAQAMDEDVDCAVKRAFLALGALP